MEQERRLIMYKYSWEVHRFIALGLIYAFWSRIQSPLVSLFPVMNSYKTPWVKNVMKARANPPIPLQRISGYQWEQMPVFFLPGNTVVCEQIPQNKLSTAKETNTFASVKELTEIELSQVCIIWLIIKREERKAPTGILEYSTADWKKGFWTISVQWTGVRNTVLHF